MRYEVLGDPFTYLLVELEPGESITAEAGAFLYGAGNYKIKTSSGGLLKGIMRSILAGESIFLNTFIAETESILAFAPPIPGKIVTLQLNNEEWYLNDRAYLAHSGDVDVSTKFLGLKGLLTRWNLFWVSIKGKGIAWINSYGDIIKLDIPSGSSITVDNSNILAFPTNAEFEIKKFGGLKSFIFGGEGLVVKIYGPTTVYMQTRSLDQFIGILAPYLRD